MANNVVLNTGAGGSTIATEQNVTEQYQKIKITDGTAGAFTNMAAVTSGSALKVDASATNQPVVGAAASGASKSGNPVQVGGVFNTTQPTVTTGQAVEAQATARGALIVATGVDGLTITPSGTQAISAASLPLPSGAATAAKQPALGTAGSASTDVITVQGITSMIALKVDGSGVTQPVSGTFWQATQPVSGTVTTSPPANASTNVAQINGVTPLMGNGVTGTGAQRVTIASDNTAFSVNPTASTTSGYTPGTLVAAATNNLTTVKASAGTLGYVSASNNAAYPIYVKVFDGSPTMGTTSAIAQWEIPCNATAANGAGREIPLPAQGLKFSTGIYLALTKGQALADNTSTAASDGSVTWGFV